MSLWTPLLWLAILTPLLLTAQLTTKKTNPKYLLLFCGYFLLDAYTRILGYQWIPLDALGLTGNWSGMLLSLAFALVFIFFHSRSARITIGFTRIFRKETLKTGLLIFLGFLVFDLIFKLLIFPKGGSFDLEQFIFQATLPGITEELVYRGILLWILSKAFNPSKRIKGVLFGWGVIIVTFLFAMIHGVVLTESMDLRVDYVTITYLFLITSLSLGILRKLSGNLILPTVAHNVINLMNFFIRLL